MDQHNETSDRVEYLEDKLNAVSLMYERCKEDNDQAVAVLRTVRCLLNVPDGMSIIEYVKTYCSVDTQQKMKPCE